MLARDRRMPSYLVPQGGYARVLCREWRCTVILFRPCEEACWRSQLKARSRSACTTNYSLHYSTRRITQPCLLHTPRSLIAAVLITQVPFSPRCPRSVVCINEYLGRDSDGIMCLNDHSTSIVLLNMSYRRLVGIRATQPADDS